MVRMSTPAMVQQDAATIRHRQLGVVIALGLGLVALGLLFNAEIAAATGTWIESTAYNHCFLVIPIAAYLAWDRRNDLRGVAAVPMPWAALAGIPVALAWLLAERLGIMEGRQLMAITFVEVLALAVFGWRLWWMLCGPLLYLYFLVPFGAFLTPKLQDITTVFVQHGLNVLHIPAYIDGYTIEIPEGTFYIAEACAGLRFLIASIAFGCLYALLMYRSPIRRTVFIVASIIVPIIANGMRAVGIVALGHLLGSAQAAATDHVLYGWIFFSLVILLLIALGLPFREDADRMAAPHAPRPVPMAPGNGQWRSAALAGGLVVVVAALSPALAAQLDRMRPPIAASIPPLVLGPDCADVPLESPAPLDAPGAMVKRRVACDGMVFDVTLDVFATRSTAAPVLTVAHTLGKLPNPTNDEEIVTESTWLPLSSGPQRLWWLTRTTRPGPMIAVAIWVDGRPATGGLATRARLAWTSLTGARIAPVVVAVSPELDHIRLTPDSRKAIEERLAAVLARADIGSQIAHFATPRD
jgi:exosortase A